MLVIWYPYSAEFSSSLGVPLSSRQFQYRPTWSLLVVHIAIGNGLTALYHSKNFSHDTIHLFKALLSKEITVKKECKLTATQWK